MCTQTKHHLSNKDLHFKKKMEYFMNLHVIFVQEAC